MIKRIAVLFLMLSLLVSMTPAYAAPRFSDNDIVIRYTAEDDYCSVEYGEEYSEMHEVALYLHCFEELPPNFITKSEAKKLGWVSREGNLWKVAYGKSIGGDRFYTRDDQIPEIVKLDCWECDVNYEGGFRDEERLVFSEDGRIYYTNDHYSTFIQLYDGWYYEDGYYRGIGGSAA